MPKRHICQGDIFKYINDELNIPQKYLCITIDKVRVGNMVESRISEVKRGKRKGYRELENKEEVFFEDCFTIKDEELGLQKVQDFVKRENLVFPGAEGDEKDTYKSYSLRMLKYGLENCEKPDSEKNLLSDWAEDILNAEDGVSEELNSDASADNDYDILEPKKATSFSKYIKDIRENWIYIFFSLVCLSFVFIMLNIYNFSTMDVFLWMINLSPPLFFVLILILAVATLIFGIVDTAIAVYIYKKNNKEHESLSYYDIYLIAKYGDRKQILSGKGRYDLGVDRICYAVFCNITGAFCSLALYNFLKTLNGFSDFIMTRHFDKMTNIGLILVLILVFANSFLLFTREPMKEFCEMEENPDTLRADRLNVIANNLHLIVNLFFSYTGIILAFIYGFSSYPQKNDMPILFSLVLLAIYVYLWFSSSSPYAVDFNAQCAGSFLLLTPFVIASSGIYTIMCFYPSANYIISIAVNLFWALVWLWFLLQRGEKSVWQVMRNNKIYFSLYAVLMILFYLLWVLS